MISAGKALSLRGERQRRVIRGQTFWKLLESSLSFTNAFWVTLCWSQNCFFEGEIMISTIFPESILNFPHIESRRIWSTVYFCQWITCSWGVLHKFLTAIFSSSTFLSMIWIDLLEKETCKTKHPFLSLRIFLGCSSSKEVNLLEAITRFIPALLKTRNKFLRIQENFEIVRFSASKKAVLRLAGSFIAFRNSKVSDQRGEDTNLKWKGVSEEKQWQVEIDGSVQSDLISFI